MEPWRGGIRLRAIAIVCALLGACAAPTPSSLAERASTPPGVAEEAVCVSAELRYRLSIPADWFAHPADPVTGVPACSRFGPEPFGFTIDELPGGGGSAWVIPLVRSCLAFDLITVVDSIIAIEVAGWPTYLIESHTGDRSDVTYVVNINPDAPVIHYPPLLGPSPGSDCRATRGLMIGTREGVPGDFDANRRVVDRMIATLQIDSD
jgi:hypothetical protein